MPVYKDNNHPGQWRVVYRYTDWTGERKQTQKRGFKTKREAAEWEREQLRQKNADLDMTFESFAELYEADMKPRLKANTWRTKETILKKKLIPYFGKRRMCDITSHDILTWQNQMMEYRDENGEGYSPVYLKTLHNQLSAIFNHAVRFYNLSKSPVSGVKNMGKKSNGEMLFWTNEEYEKFANAMMDKPRSYYAFELLYWCGIREGELLALTPADFDFEKGTVRINKSYQRIAKQDMITTPKTEKSNRTITLPDTVANEIKDYLKTLYKPDDDERMRSEFLKEHRPIEFTHLVLSGNYDRVLSELNEQAENRLQLLITQMKENEHVTEAMKRVDQMGWVARMNSIRSRAEEIVMNEMIYC